MPVWKRTRLLTYMAIAVVAGALGFLVQDAAPEVFADEAIAKEAPAIAFKGARIHTATGPVIDRGTLVIHKGKIIAVGDQGDIAIPPGAEVHDVAGKTIIPGLVDTHSHIGIFPRPQVAANQDGNEMTGPVQPGLRAIDAINPHDPGIRMALAGGVTTANIMPGSGNAIGGQTLYVQLKGTLIDMMRTYRALSLAASSSPTARTPRASTAPRAKHPEPA